MNKHITRIASARRARLAALVCAVLSAVVVAGPPAQAAAPQPVSPRAMPDPGVYYDEVKHRFQVASTGHLAPRHASETVGGKYVPKGAALSRFPAWVDTKGADDAVWAPDQWRNANGERVLYFSAPAYQRLGGRCVGAAKFDVQSGKFVPEPRPLACPWKNADDNMAGRPDAAGGAIDPSPFRDSKGRQFLLYRTLDPHDGKQASIRMMELGPHALHKKRGTQSRELIRRPVTIENPVMVQRGSKYVLFGSRDDWRNCRYHTSYFVSDSRWSFQNRTERKLATTKGTGICGPGGADVTPVGNGKWRIFFHGWVCGSGTTPCTNGNVGRTDKRRVMYAANLTWDGTTPKRGDLF